MFWNYKSRDKIKNNDDPIDDIHHLRGSWNWPAHYELMELWPLVQQGITLNSTGVLYFFFIADNAGY